MKDASSSVFGRSFTALFSLFVFVGCFASFSASADVSGVVYRDFNLDGIRNGFGSATDVGLQGFSVTLTDAQGATLSTLTNASGEFVIPTASLTGSLFRLEASIPLSQQGFVRPGVATNGSGLTSVQFLSSPNVSGVEFSFIQLTDYCQSNPNLVTPIMNRDPREGSAQHPVQKNPSILSYPITSRGNFAPLTIDFTGFPDAFPGSSYKDIGTVYSLAYLRDKDTLFAASFLKRLGDFGVGGTGAIYAIKSGVPQVWADVNALFGPNTAGANPHTWGPSILDFENYDSGVLQLAFRVGFGGMKLSADGKKLYAVNLADKQVYEFPTLTTPTVANVRRFPIPRPATCTDEFYYPFPLARKGDKIYVGASCMGPTADDVVFHIYELGASGFNSSPFQTVVLPAFDTRYPSYPKRQPFQTSYSSPGPIFGGAPESPETIVSDFDFIGDDIAFTFRSAITDRRGAWYYFGVDGAVMRSCYDSGTQSYLLENNAVCGGITGDGVNNSGSGVSKTFFRYPNTPRRGDDSTGGALFYKEGFPLISSYTDMYENASFSSGIVFNNPVNGSLDGKYLINREGAGGIPWGDGFIAFGKSATLGDIEALCDKAPLEIGERVWLDTNGNGIQDPQEPGIKGVTLELIDVDAGTTVGGTTTDSAGHYFFGGVGNKGMFSGALKPFTQYTVRISLSDPQLSSLFATTTSSGSSTIDSNGSVVGAYSSYSFTTGGSTENDHTIDFGFAPPPPPSTPTPTPTSTPTITTTTEVDLKGLQVAFDSNALLLRRSADAIINELAVIEGTSTCKKISRQKKRALRSLVRTQYVKIWGLIWSTLPSHRNEIQGGELPTNCKVVNVTQPLNAIRSELNALGSIATSRAKRCSRHEAINISKRRIKKITATLDATFNSYPSSFAYCS